MPESLDTRFNNRFCYDCIGQERGCSGCPVKDALDEIDSLREDVDLLTASRAELKARIARAEGLLRRIAGSLVEAQGIMRREGFVLDNLQDRWQKLAFTLYTMLAEQATDAKEWVEEGGRDA
jgi:hypothetical protein